MTWFYLIQPKGVALKGFIMSVVVSDPLDSAVTPTGNKGMTAVQRLGIFIEGILFEVPPEAALTHEPQAVVCKEIIDGVPGPVFAVVDSCFEYAGEKMIDTRTESGMWIEDDVIFAIYFVGTYYIRYT
jgi:hypothetical protein